MKILGAILGIGLLFIALFGLGVAFWGWIIMLAMGALYHEAGMGAAISFKVALIPGFVVTLIIGAMSKS
jgi:hypothetical protein